MDIREFSNKLADATKNMSDEERASLMKMFQSVSGDIAQVTPAQAAAPAASQAQQPGGHPAYYSSIDVYKRQAFPGNVNPGTAKPANGCLF